MKAIRKIKEVLKYLIPIEVRVFLLGLIPRIYLLNTYLLNHPQFINNLCSISEKYLIRTIGWNDEQKIRKAHSFRGPGAFSKRIPDRLNSSEWVGLAVFDKNNGDIAYMAWIIINSIRYFEEFGVHLQAGQFLLKDGFCVPEYRHQGLHTRMEQERINYCVRNGATEIYIQIHNNNEKGKDSVIKNGYKLFHQRYIIQWPAFNIYRDLKAFLKNPFVKVVK